MSEKTAVFQTSSNAGGRESGPRLTKAQFSQEFLDMWKRESVKCTDSIFLSLPIEGPTVSGALKQHAIDAVMRTVWSRVYEPGEPDAIWENLDAIKKYTADLVDKAVAERWERVTATR